MKIKKKQISPKIISKWIFNVTLGIGLIILVSHLVSAWTAEETIEIQIDDGTKSTFHGIIEVVARPIVPTWGQDQVMQFDVESINGAEIGFNFDLSSLESGLYNLSASLIDADGNRTSAAFLNNLILNTKTGPDFTANFHPENIQNSLLLRPTEKGIKMVEVD